MLGGGGGGGSKLFDGCGPVYVTKQGCMRWPLSVGMGTDCEEDSGMPGKGQLMGMCEGQTVLARAACTVGRTPVI